MRNFTITFPQDTGTADRLFQHDFLYRLGKGMDYNYVHTPFHYSADGFHACERLPLDDFLGIDIDEEPCRDSFLGHVPVVELAKFGIVQASDLKDFIESNYLAEQTIRLNFAWKDGIDHKVTRSEYMDLPVRRMNYAEKYRKRRESWPIRLFDENKIKIGVHVRRGDITWLEHEGKIFTAVPVRTPVDTSKHYQVLSALLAKFGEKNCSCHLFSDGYDIIPRSFEINGILIDRRFLDFLIQEQYEKDFRKFDDFPTLRKHIGETTDSFQQYVHMAATADYFIGSSGLNLPYWLNPLCKVIDIGDYGWTTNETQDYLRQ